MPLRIAKNILKTMYKNLKKNKSIIAQSVQIVLFMLIIILMPGCSGSDNDLQLETPNEYLINLNDQVITVLDFKRKFTNVESLYSYNSIQDSDFINDAMLRFFYQLVDEMVLTERAAELQINITDEDVEKVVNDIKKDYPDDNFENIFFENAVPYNFWRDGVKMRLLMAKVIEKDLGDKVTIIPEDITKYYKEYCKNKNEKTKMNIESSNITEQIVKQLRRKKSEEAYNSWINGLKKKYILKINTKQLDKIIHLSSQGK